MDKLAYSGYHQRRNHKERTLVFHSTESRYSSESDILSSEPFNLWLNSTFGLGQTRLNWSEPIAITERPITQDLTAQRIVELTDYFTAQRKRIGGDRATQIAETWATILARRELGESLQAIAEDMKMPYETVKTYAKLARRALKS